MIRRPPRSTLFTYTTLFRSLSVRTLYCWMKRTIAATLARSMLADRSLITRQGRCESSGATRPGPLVPHFPVAQYVIVLSVPKLARRRKATVASESSTFAMDRRTYCAAIPHSGASGWELFEPVDRAEIELRALTGRKTGGRCPAGLHAHDPSGFEACAVRARLSTRNDAHERVHALSLRCTCAPLAGSLGLSPREAEEVCDSALLLHQTRFRRRTGDGTAVIIVRHRLSRAAFGGRMNQQYKRKQKKNQQALRMSLKQYVWGGGGGGALLCVCVCVCFSEAKLHVEIE